MKKFLICLLVFMLGDKLYPSPLSQDEDEEEEISEPEEDLESEEEGWGEEIE